MAQVLTFLSILRHLRIIYYAIFFYRIHPSSKFVIFAFFQKAVEMCFLSIFTMLIYQYISLRHNRWIIFFFSIYDIKGNELYSLQTKYNGGTCIYLNGVEYYVNSRSFKQYFYKPLGSKNQYY